MVLTKIIQFLRPTDKPTPSVVYKEFCIVNLSGYNIDTIGAIANKIEYDLSHLSRKSVAFQPDRITENMRNAIIAEMQKHVDDSLRGGKAYITPKEIRMPYPIADGIRQMLFDFELWLTDASLKLDTTGVVFNQIKKDYEHSRLIRKGLLAPVIK